METNYHHGDLPRALLAHAAEMAAEGNPESITLRGLARRAGVTHSAPVHHFGTRKKLLTVLATSGFAALNMELALHARDIKEMGKKYVLWALNNPGHYAVMWLPRVLDESSPELTAERERAWTLLSEAVEAGQTTAARDERSTDAQAAFALVHGLASLWLSGALATPIDQAKVVESVIERLVLADSERAAAS